MMRHTWYEAQSRDDHISRGDFEESLPRCTVLAVKPDFLEDDVLIEVDPIKAGAAEQISRKHVLGLQVSVRDVQQEP